MREQDNFEAGIPESFNVLVKEMRSLGLNVELASTKKRVGELPPAEAAEQAADAFRTAWSSSAPASLASSMNASRGASSARGDAGDGTMNEEVSNPFAPAVQPVSFDRIRIALASPEKMKALVAR